MSQEEQQFPGEMSENELNAQKAINKKAGFLPAFSPVISMMTSNTYH
ncbi:hypothetical protein [Mixta sp. Marseille-Q2659]|nr:hypothetical protein [Mixta sp. Marseille-Q2659]